MLSVSSKAKHETKAEPADRPAGHTEPKAPRLPWGPRAAIAFGLAAFVLAQLVAFFLISFWFLGQGQSWGEASTSWIEGVSGQFAFVVVSEALVMLAIWAFLRRRKASFKLLGFARRPNWDDLGYALVGFVVYFGLLIVVAGLVNAFTNVNMDQRQELGFDAIASSPEKIMAFVSLVVLPPIVEEIVFRGFLFTGLRSKIPFIGAAIITSLLFAAPHLLASSEGLLWVAGIDTLVLSLVLCYLREKTGALWSSIAVHAIKNSIAFVFFLSYVAGA